MLKKKSFIKLMNILKAEDERRSGIAGAIGAAYNFVPERECLMSKNDAECVFLDLCGGNDNVLGWLKEEMNDKYDYIGWFAYECDYGKEPNIVYVPYNVEERLFNMYLVDTPEILFHIIAEPNFGTQNTVCTSNVKSHPYAFIHSEKGKQYDAIGTCNKQGVDGILVVDDDFGERTYTQRSNGRFVLESEPDDSDNFIEQLANQKFVDYAETRINN